MLYCASVLPWLFYVGLGRGAVIGFLTIWDAMSNLAGQAAVLRLTANACDDLLLEVEELWRRVEAGRIGTEDRHCSIAE